jgi:hypothetical protein
VVIREFVARTVAGLLSLVLLGSLLLAPLLGYRLIAGIPLSASGPDWEIWLLVTGGGIGAGAARLLHYHILTAGSGGTRLPRAARGMDADRAVV